jgi:8-oxo-dGTP diphosphatase
MWLGNPQENDEMKPIWSMINEIPFESVWDDASDWLPLPLKGESTRASFVYRDDNETVGEAKIEDWEEGRPRW